MASRGHGLTRMLLATLLFAASLQWAAPAQARTFTVCPSGCEYDDISEAIVAARDGDEVSIGEGVYEDFFTVNRNVTLRGAGRDKTTIKGRASGPVVSVSKSANVAILDLTITGGGGALGGGISNEGQLTLTRSAVRGNTSTFARGGGGGIWSKSTKPLRIVDSDITGNSAAGGGGGIYIEEGEASIRRTTISGNRTSGAGGGILHEGRERLWVWGSVISGNEAADAGGGVRITHELLLEESTVSGNTARAGGGLAGGDKVLRLNRSAVVENDASGGRGGGILAGPGGVRLRYGATVTGNTSLEGAGIHAQTGDVDVSESTIAGNVAAEIGGGIFSASAEISLNSGRVLDNRAGERGGGIYVGEGGELGFNRQTVISGNQPDQCFGADC